MNQTPRALNRVILAVLGLALMLLGGLAVALALFPGASGWWQRATAGAGERLGRLLAATTLPGQPVSWLWAVAAVMLLVLILLLLAWAALQGRGRVGTLAVDGDGDGTPGIVSLSAAVAEQPLKAALQERPDIVHAAVAAYEYRGVPGLHVRVLPRQGASPQAVAGEVMDLVEALDLVVGIHPPVVVSIGSGARARLVRADRVH
ncbi:hypothetical protein [Arthrobacter mobilis]|uniref:Alkaline shock response membrane anchor protein AmaP n=1 Tax=Arthrobacter mobilis TaxID=2724944 RepID=A0A7X6K6H5_9MICC|nr:hypothetical protein [Arthrobacter mobilis]NKX55013.1 hypothetical protein [Arthrobacter mobilis]